MTHVQSSRDVNLPGGVLAGIHAGSPVYEVALQGADGMTARILTWGAVVSELMVPDKSGSLQNVVLGFENFDDYPKYSPYFGAVVGRFANRIADGKFTLHGRTYELDRNEGNRTTLHGGSTGFARRVWEIDQLTDNSLTLQLVSQDGDQGFPGKVVARCTYTLDGHGALRFAVSATTDQPTPVSLAQHSYFNLDGSKDLSAHTLRVNASFYTPVDHSFIPTGSIESLNGNVLDLRLPRRLDGSVDYDTNYVIDRKIDAGPMAHAAELWSLSSGIKLSVTTTKPGLQVYDGNRLSVQNDRGKKLFGKRAGVCLETQYFPNSPNIKAFPNCVLLPGQSYEHVTDYRFVCETN